jgi:TIR domain
MKHIFVSHAGADVAAAERLALALRNAGHDTKVDTKELGLGGDSITFMNESIAQAHTVIVLYSRHTPNAEWQKLEIKAAVWNEVAQCGGNCIVVRLDVAGRYAYSTASGIQDLRNTGHRKRGFLSKARRRDL